MKDHSYLQLKKKIRIWGCTIESRWVKDSDIKIKGNHRFFHLLTDLAYTSLRQMTFYDKTQDTSIFSEFMSPGSSRKQNVPNSKYCYDPFVHSSSYYSYCGLFYWMIFYYLTHLLYFNIIWITPWELGTYLKNIIYIYIL